MSFGDSYAQSAPDLLRFLGAPSRDTGTINPFSAYGTCPGTDLRVLEYAGGALQVFFGTRRGARQMTVYSWSLTAPSAAAPKASARVGGRARFAFGPGTTLRQLEAGAGRTLRLADDELTGPSFRVEDRSGGFFGTLEGDRVRSVSAGEGCGE